MLLFRTIRLHTIVHSLALAGNLRRGRFYVVKLDTFGAYHFTRCDL
jgi:hypothetical protein